MVYHVELSLADSVTVEISQRIIDTVSNNNNIIMATRRQYCGLTKWLYLYFDTRDGEEYTVEQWNNWLQNASCNLIKDVHVGLIVTYMCVGRVVGCANGSGKYLRQNILNASICSGAGGKKVICSESQRLYFSKSVLLDKDGHPMRLYHGSNSVFDNFSKVQLNNDSNDAYGSGYYFATSKSLAKSYGGNIYTCYVDMRKPLYIDGEKHMSNNYIEFTCTQSRRIMAMNPSLKSTDLSKNIMGDYLPDIWEYDGKLTRSTLRQFVLEFLNNNIDCTDMVSLAAMYGDEYAYEFRQALHTVLGYDGVIVRLKGTKAQEHNYFVIPWFLQQIKAVDNIKPRRSPFLHD